MKTEKCIIIGGSGSGKDFLFRSLVNKGLRGCLKVTTRPMRTNESNNREYKFLNDSYFDSLLSNNEFYVYESFTINSGSEPIIWRYGITNNEFNKSQVFIMTPSEFSKIDSNKRKECFVVYLDIDRSIRESRLINRDDRNDSIERRLNADDLDFKNFKDYDLKITDSEFDPDDIYNLMF